MNHEKRKKKYGETLIENENMDNMQIKNIQI